VLEGQGRNPGVAADITNQAHKARDPADPMIVRREPIELRPDIEILTLQSDHRLSPR